MISANYRLYSVLPLVLCFILIASACAPSSSSTASQSTAENKPLRIVNDDLIGLGADYKDCAGIQAKAAAISTHHYQLSILEVPLDWDLPASEKTKVAFHVFTPVVPSTEDLPPVLEFTGGPGANSKISIERDLIDGVFANHGKNRTLIFFDHRGTAGCSDPFFMEAGANPVEARKHAALYASESIIRDVEAFRKSKGIKRWVLSGSSHGSLLIHRYLAELSRIESEAGDSPIAGIHAQVDPGTETWRDRLALRALYQFRKAKTEVDTDALLKQEKLYLMMFNSLGDSDCVYDQCGTSLKANLLLFRKWLSMEEIAQIAAGFAQSDAQGKQVFMAIMATFLPNPAFGQDNIDPCKWDRLNADSVESKTRIAECFNSAVNSFDTSDSLDQMFTPADYCHALSKIGLSGSLLQAFMEMCPTIAGSDAMERVYSGPQKPIVLAVLKQNLERFQIPMTLVMGQKDEISPPETYFLELRALGFDAESVISYCYDLSQQTRTKAWESNLVKVILQCDRGHEASFPF